MLNNMYKSKQSESSSLEEGGERLSLLELNSLVRRSLEQCLPDEYWIQTELSDVRSNTTGHCYLEFVQKDSRSNNLVAKARGMIWNNIYRLLKPYFEESTGQLFTSGIKVLVKVTVQFHELYGYSLTVLDIDPAYTLGDMARRRREILLQLEEEEMFEIITWNDREYFVRELTLFRGTDRKSTRLNSSHSGQSRMPSSA